MKTVAVSAHEKNLRAMRCVVSDRYGVTLHHVHGGSMLTLGPEWPNPGHGQRANPFLQIPLAAEYHVGYFGIDNGLGAFSGVVEWEEAFGNQLVFLTEVNACLPYDLFEQALLWAGKL